MPKRIAILMKDITFIIFSNICRGLFNTHKLIFSFMLAAQIQLKGSLDNRITYAEWDLFLKGVVVDHEAIKSTKKPTGSEEKDNIFNEKSWRFLLNLECSHMAFEGLPKQIVENIDEWVEWAQQKEPQLGTLPGDWEHRLTQF